MIWIGFIIGFAISAPVGYFLGKRELANKAKKGLAKKPKKKPLTFDEMMSKAWTDMPKDPSLAAEVDADIEARLRQLED